ncbi:MAG: DUF1801 domain-containing protein [Gammaproteobacteria bacterium]|nr:DUF1801 domain-containing protein [Gammaproteobacteria bacterium]
MKRVKTPFASDAVRDTFAEYPSQIQSKLLDIRELIFTTAATNPVIGPLEETLKWGEPACRTTKSRSGSTIRIAWSPRSPTQFGVYFNCQITLISTAKTLFPDLFQFSGNRAIIFERKDAIPHNALGVCIEAALTCHADKKKRKRKQ